jgi:hypothetical protein
MARTGPDGRNVHAGSLERCHQLLLAVLLACAVLLGGIAPRGVAAQTAPPSPILGSGDYIKTENHGAIATWEEYAGGMLLIWRPDHVYRAFAGSCGAGGPAVCYTWIAYFFNNADPYDSKQWVPTERGCLVLGADPLTVGEADGYARTTDTVAGPSAWAQTLSLVSGEGTLNPLATGLAPAPPPGSWAPTSYDQCFGGVTTLRQRTPGQCTWSGTYQAPLNGNAVVLTLQQVGDDVTGSYTFLRDNVVTSGTITGVVRTNFPGYTVLDGYWHEPDGGGARLWFTMPLDPCSQFTGSYTSTDTPEEWIAGWDGVWSCEDDSDCAEGQVCDLTEGVCVPGAALEPPVAPVAALVAECLFQGLLKGGDPARPKATSFKGDSADPLGLAFWLRPIDITRDRVGVWTVRSFHTEVGLDPVTGKAISGSMTVDLFSQTFFDQGGGSYYQIALNSSTLVSSTCSGDVGTLQFQDPVIYYQTPPLEPELPRRVPSVGYTFTDTGQLVLCEGFTAAADPATQRQECLASTIALLDPQ